MDHLGNYQAADIHQTVAIVSPPHHHHHGDVRVVIVVLCNDIVFGFRY